MSSPKPPSAGDYFLHNVRSRYPFQEGHSHEEPDPARARQLGLQRAPWETKPWPDGLWAKQQWSFDHQLV